LRLNGYAGFPGTIHIYASYIPHLRDLRSTSSQEGIPISAPNGAATPRFYPRLIRPLIVEALNDTRIVFVAGARQVGKTTLTAEIIADEHPMESFSLDDKATRETAIADPTGFVADIQGPAFIDEIHRAPDLLLALKQAVDADTTPGRFLITGSANVLASKRVKDALPGRIDRVQMWPLAQSEINGGQLNFVDELFAGRVPRVTGAVVGHRAFSTLVAEGGYPEARLRASGRRRTRWFENYIDSTLDRDLRELADARRIDDVGRLLRLLATQSANLLNYRSVAQRLEMDPKTVKAYVVLLEQMFLVQRLPAWRPGLGARESSTPKIYVCDSGLLVHLLGADERRVEDDDQVTGKVCETFVAGELLKHATWADEVVRLHHYQRDREDVDLVLENRRGDIAAVEVKARATITPKDWRWIAKLRDARGEQFRAGAIVYSGAQTLPLGDRLWAVPFAALSA
jgi:predicted AAA+ superfamily ATPase